MKRILVLYKTSVFQHRYLRGRDSGVHPGRDNLTGRFLRTHERHYQALTVIEAQLKSLQIPYDKVARGKPLNTGGYDLIVSVGGDGTFLEAARSVKRQYLLGVNSDPDWSVGRFCSATAFSFPKKIRDILRGRFRVVSLARMALRVKGQPGYVNVLNDILFCHRNPAAMSRYIIQIQGRREEQRSSGVWVATPAGSTGAIHSAGGKKIPMSRRILQYRARELYSGGVAEPGFKGGLIAPDQKFTLISLMKEGVVYIDGSHEERAMPFAQQLELTVSKDDLAFIT